MAADWCVAFRVEAVIAHIDADKKMRGIYAVRVTGRPPADVIDAIEARGGVYRPRDAVED